MVAEAHNVTPSQLLGKRRDRHLVVTRWKAIWLCRKAFPGTPLREIGRWFNRDHGTILYAIQSIVDWPHEELEKLAKLEERLALVEPPSVFTNHVGKRVLVRHGSKLREAKVLGLSDTGEYVKVEMGGPCWFPVQQLRLLDTVNERSVNCEQNLTETCSRI